MTTPTDLGSKPAADSLRPDSGMASSMTRESARAAGYDARSYTPGRPEPDKAKSAQTVAVLTGALALIATLGAAWVKGVYDSRLERQRFQSELVLQAMQSNSTADRVASLKFMMDTRLISDPGLTRALTDLVRKSASDSNALPQITPAGTTFPTPVVRNARVFLLSGVQKDSPALEGLGQDLAKAGYTVVGRRVIPGDDSRPAGPEVTYFNMADRAQAEAIAAIMRQRLSNVPIAAVQRSDATAGSGYLEIWLGKQ